MCLILQETRFQVQVLKPCKYIQESNEKVKDFKTFTASIYWGLKSCESRTSTTISIDTLSVEVYKTQFFRAVFHPIREYVFRFSFLTTLNIYRDCFKGHHSWCNSIQKFFISILWTGDICPNSSFSWRSCCICTP